MAEDEIERNRRLARALLHRARPLVERGFHHLHAGVREAARDLRAGKEKKATRQLAKVDREIRVAERNATPTEEHRLALLKEEVDRTRHELHGRRIVEGEFTLVKEDR